MSSFGISGTNAHLILEEATEEAPTEEPVEEPFKEPAEGAVVPWVLSARGAEALRAQAARLRDHLLAHPDARPHDIGLSLVTTRTAFEHRAVVLGTDRADLLRGLGELAAGAPGPDVVTGVTRTGGRTAFLFTGQGAQRAGMGRELHRRHPVFAAAFDEVCARIPGLREVVLGDVVLGDEKGERGEGAPAAGVLDETRWTQPALFAYEVALFRLLESLGVHPDVVTGHSVGEIAAAHAAGVLSLDDACALVAARGRLMQELPAGGAMVAVRASGEEVLPLLAGREHEIGVAAFNGPSATVVSGTEEAVAEVAAHFAAQGRRTTRLRVSHAFHSPLMEPMLAEFRKVAEGIAYAPPRLTVVSALTGERATAEQLTDPGHWVRHVREAVRCHDAVRAAAESGATRFLEVGPDATLTALARASLEDRPGVLAVAAARRDRPEERELLTALARLHAHGADVDWRPLLPGGRRVPLPTYAFQRQRYWLPTAPFTGDLHGAGLEAAGHPFLGAAVTSADSGTVLLTGRLSLRTHPWLADHAVLGRAILPATGHLDLALHVGDRVGCPHVGELTLNSPLEIPRDGAVQLQVAVDAPDGTGRRAFRVFARPADTDLPWRRHAQGVLAPDAPPAPADGLTAWPPPGAEPVTPDDPYAAFAVAGFAYGPGFQGLRRVWRRGDEVFAEAVLPDACRADAARFALHPALFDSAVQALLVARPGEEQPGGEQPGEEGGTATADGPMLPFAWSGLTLHAEGATALRVRLTPAGHPHGYTVLVTDTAGTPVASAASITLRAVPADPSAERPRPEPLRLDWQPADPAPAAPPARSLRWVVLGDGDDTTARALDEAGVHLETYADPEALAKAAGTGMTLPEVVLVAPDPRPASGAAVPETVRGLLTRTHELLREWLTDDRFASARLVFVTRGALTAGNDTHGTDNPEGTHGTDGPGGMHDTHGPGGMDGTNGKDGPEGTHGTDGPGDTGAAGGPDLAGAALWGLVRSAQAEHPGRLHLVDLPTSAGASDVPALLAAIASAAPQSAVRAGQVLVPRVAPAEQAAAAPDLGSGTVLVTGATGTLGRTVARHLVTAHGVRSLLLASRGGPGAPGADDLVAELAGLGARVRLETCDIAERAQVERLLALVPEEAPLTAVVHAAGVVDDATVTALDGRRFDRVLRPKADGAWHLHELTAGRGLSAFVLFSSAAGTFGSPGQGNYAAANAFLDALAAHRHARGLPATSIAWGLWEAASGITAGLSATDRRRMARGGMRPLATDDALALLDAALRTRHPAVVALDAPGGRAGVAALLRPAAPARRSAAPASAAPAGVAALLADKSPGERRGVLLGLVRDLAATVLGHASADAVAPDRLFTEQGFDSLTVVELRNHLASATALHLPPTLLFDHPTPEALAAHLDERLADADPAAPQAPARPDAPAPNAADTLGGLFRHACETGRVDEGFKLLQAAAGLRPTFDTPADLAAPPSAIRLAAGDGAAGDGAAPLVCFSSYVALAGVHQYARFAAAFRGRRDVWALPTQGFGAGEPLPASFDTVADLYADAVARTVGDTPAVLLGSSSGGILALAAARRLQERGRPPAAVVLLDTYMPRADSPFLRFSQQMLGGMFDRESMFAHLDTDRLTAMSWYIALVGEWEPGPLDSPVLLVRSSEPPVAPQPGTELRPEEWQTSWDRAHTVVDVPGNHFTMMETHARTTAEATADWLARLTG
ncbi:SDR family NAD(P)-dependent oxidoreductase [Streptomyces echinoruber]|uniref:SDR family NAD(P)-dependent oxidoreductase n=1 Tax=Streptomyces echinoruber TaxID=68898 RepID=UPI0036114D9D